MKRVDARLAWSSHSDLSIWCIPDYIDMLVMVIPITVTGLLVYTPVDVLVMYQMRIPGDRWEPFTIDLT